MKNYLLLFTLFLLFSCSNKQFDSEKWKAEENEQFYMLSDIINNNRLEGKTKKDIIKLLDTTNIKQFRYKDNCWWFVILKPHAKGTQSPVTCMYIYFKNDKVKSVTINN